MGIIEELVNNFSSSDLNLITILSVLFVTLILSFYCYFVSHFVSHRAFYNKSFNIGIAILPFFISTLVLCLETNALIALSALGALSVIRYRTAIKDPVDMIYILWSIYIGILCGSKLYEVAIVTSLMVTLILLILEKITIAKRPYILVIHAKEDVNLNISSITKKYRVKSRNYTSSGVDYTIEISLNNKENLIKLLKDTKEIERFSLIEYDSEDIM